MAQPETDRRPLRLRAMPPGRLRRKRQNPHHAGRHNNRTGPAAYRMMGGALLRAAAPLHAEPTLRIPTVVPRVVGRLGAFADLDSHLVGPRRDERPRPSPRYLYLFPAYDVGDPVGPNGGAHRAHRVDELWDAGRDSMRFPVRPSCVRASVARTTAQPTRAPSSRCRARAGVRALRDDALRTWNRRASTSKLRACAHDGRRPPRGFGSSLGNENVVGHSYGSRRFARPGKTVCSL